MVSCTLPVRKVERKGSVRSNFGELIMRPVDTWWVLLVTLNPIKKCTGDFFHGALRIRIQFHSPRCQTKGVKRKIWDELLGNGKCIYLITYSNAPFK